ncbi:MAG: chorismate mutase, partial [Planctomycetota bacterium]|nr:chorismate mutase [Planctomycetota bacterium]
MKPPTPSPEPDRTRPLPVLRAMIDALDHDLLRLLARRDGIVAEIAEYKRRHTVPIRDAGRERDIIADRRDRAAPLGIAPEFAESLFRLVLWASRDRQAALRAEVPP